MDYILSIPYLPYILLVIAAFFVYQRFATRVRVRVPGRGAGGPSMDGVLDKILGPSYAQGKLNRTIAAYKKQGQYLPAGKLLEDAGRLPEAVEAYIEGQEYYAAAVNLEKMGRLEKAADLYLQAGDYKKSAQVFIAANKPAKAASLFLEKGNALEAARLFGQAGQWDRAAELYAKGGYPLRAAEAFEKKEDWAKAAECYEKHFMENVSFATTYSSTSPSADQKSALQAGRLYEKAGALPRALQIYSRGGYFKEAADVCMLQGQFGKAAELYLRAEDNGRAADAGDTSRAIALLQRVGTSDESFRAATEILARLFLETGRAGLAAERLQRAIGGQPISSANVDLFYWLAIALEKDKPADALAT